MYSIQNRHEILLAKPINKVIYNKLQASKPTSNYKLTLILQRLTDRHNNDPPALILDLLATLLDYFLETFNNC